MSTVHHRQKGKEIKKMSSRRRTYASPHDGDDEEEEVSMEIEQNSRDSMHDIDNSYEDDNDEEGDDDDDE